jgi:hypothetical protein
MRRGLAAALRALADRLAPPRREVREWFYTSGTATTPPGTQMVIRRG